MKPVSLKQVADELEFVGDGFAVYISTRTGQVVPVTEDVELMLDDENPPDWAQDIIPEVRQALSSDEFVQMPDAYEIHEYSIMENFCYEIEDEALRNKLLNLIRGKGAFRRFKNFVIYNDIDKDWYLYRGRALKEICREFLEENNIPFTDNAE